MSNVAANSPTPQLTTPVQLLKGVGPQRAELLARLELFTAADVLFFFPRDYQDLTDLASVADLTEDKLVGLRGQIEEVELRGGRSGKSILGVLIHCDGNGPNSGGDEFIRAVWFNMPHMMKRLEKGKRVLLS